MADTIFYELGQRVGQEINTLKVFTEHLGDDSDPERGAAMVAGSAVVLDSLYGSDRSLREFPGRRHGDYAVTCSHHPGGTVGGARYFWDAGSVLTDDGGTIIQPDSVTGAGRWVLDPSVDIRPELFGALPNVDVDQSESLQKFFDVGGEIDAGHDGYYYVTKVGLEALPFYGITPKAGSHVQFRNGTRILVEPGVDIRHVFCGTAPDREEHVAISDIIIDCNFSASNGIGFSSARNIAFIRPTIYRCRSGNFAADPLTTFLGGGRAITFQFRNENIHVVSPTCIDCDFAVDVVGSMVNPNWNCSVVGLHAEDCAVVIEAISNDPNAGLRLNEDPYNMDTTGVVFSNVTFRNCGRSRLGQANSSWTRQNNNGNCLPFASPARAGTTYDPYDWLLSVYDPGAAEWSPSTTYTVGAKVKYTDTGTSGALFAIDRAAGVSILGVRGKNESGYGRIGAVVRGLSKSLQVRDCVVTVDCDYIYRAGPTPIMGVLTRPFEIAEGVDLEITNYGVTRAVVESDNPIGTGLEHAVRGCSLKVWARPESNTSVVGPRLAASAGDPTTLLELRSLGGGGRFVGTFAAAAEYASIGAFDKTGSNDGEFFEFGNCVQVSAVNASAVLRLRRKGSSAGFVDLMVNGNNLSIPSTTIIGTGAWNSGQLLRLGPYRFWVDSSGRLRIKNGDPSSDTDGTVVGAQT